MSIAAGIALIVLGAIFTFAVKGGHIGDLDLHAVGVILMLAGIIGILLPKHEDGAQTFAEHFDADPSFNDGRKTHGPRRSKAGSG